MKNALTGLVAALLLALPWALPAQTELSGYVFEENNRGYLALAQIRASDMEGLTRGETFSDEDGRYALSLPAGRYILLTEKEAFEPRRDTVTLTEARVFFNIRLSRKPGYIFEATLAHARSRADIPVEAISGASIEVFNLSSGQTELNLDRHPDPFFSFTLEQGNHYVMLIRKPGFLARRIELLVNVEGCILCIEGVKSLRSGNAPADKPAGVTDNISLASRKAYGSLIANIELEKAELDKRIGLKNIYYDYDKWDIRADAQPELDKAAQMLLDNPGLSVELGSHTDLRGSDAYNDTLSQRRAESAVRYIMSKGVEPARISAKGYGKRQPIKNCIKCSEADHQLNRRTELRITGLQPEAWERLNWKPLEQLIREEQARAPRPMPEANNSVPLPRLKKGQNNP